MREDLFGVLWITRIQMQTTRVRKAFSKAFENSRYVCRVRTPSEG